MEALLPLKRPASDILSQARSKRLRLHLRHLKFLRFLLSKVLQLRRQLLLRCPLSKASDRQPSKSVSRLAMVSRPGMVSRLARSRNLATVSNPAMVSSPAMVSRPAKSRNPVTVSKPAMARIPALVSRPDMDNRQDMENRQDMASSMESKQDMASSLDMAHSMAHSMASSPPPPLLALSNPSKLRSKLLLAPTATVVLRRVLALIPSLDSVGPQHPADLRVSANLALPALASSVNKEVMVLVPATVPLKMSMASRPRPATASRPRPAMASRLAMASNLAMVLLRPATAAQAVDTVAPQAASVASAATAETAAMALPPAVLLVVLVVDMVEAALLVVDLAVPDTEAQAGGEELSFCVYG